MLHVLEAYQLCGQFCPGCYESCTHSTEILRGESLIQFLNWSCSIPSSHFVAYPVVTLCETMLLDVKLKMVHSLFLEMVIACYFYGADICRDLPAHT